MTKEQVSGKKNSKVPSQSFYHAGAGTSSCSHFLKWTWPFQPSLWGRLSPTLAARRTTFPRGPRIYAQAHLENYGVRFFRNWQVPPVRLLSPPVSSLSRSLSSTGSACLCVSLQAGLMASLLRFDGQVVLVTGAGGGEFLKARGRAPPPPLPYGPQPQLLRQDGRT